MSELGVFGEAAAAATEQWCVAYSISTQTPQDAEGERQVLPLDLQVYWQKEGRNALSLYHLRCCFHLGFVRWKRFLKLSLKCKICL